MLSQTSDYTLPAVVALSRSGDAPRSTRQVSQETRVPQAYLAKIFQSLVRAGIVHSQRGLGGGVSLARPVSKLTILEVVNAVDPIVRIKSCLLGLRTHGVHLCALHRRLDEALALVEEAFSSSTMEEVLAESPNVQALCEVRGPRLQLTVRTPTQGPFIRSGPTAWTRRCR